MKEGVGAMGGCSGAALKGSKRRRSTQHKVGTRGGGTSVGRQQAVEEETGSRQGAET